jgi:hypothetical protein
MSSLRSGRCGMIDVTQPVSLGFIAETVGVIFIVIALGIMIVRNAKRRKESR